VNPSVIPERLERVMDPAVHLRSGAGSNPPNGKVDACVIAKGGYRDQDGYVRYGHGGIRAHRIAWERANGRPVPEGHVVMHSCDNPPCVNPAHLSVGTIADNNADRAAKGRSYVFPSGDAHPARIRRGSAHWQAKLTEADVTSIRVRRANGESTASLGRVFGVHPATISRIARGLWRNEVQS